MLKSKVWQHPYVNVFKLCEVEKWQDVDKEGEVEEIMDKVIGKKVIKLTGTISAGNFIRIPKSRHKVLGLTGRFLYLQIKVNPVKNFVIHVEVLTANHNNYRISVSNMYKHDNLKKQRTRGIELPYPDPTFKWCILALDLATATSTFSSSPFHCLKAVHLCSWLNVRGVYTSDLKFSLENLPREMCLSHALETSAFEMRWLPEEPIHVPVTEYVMPKQRTTSPSVAAPDTRSSTPSPQPNQVHQKLSAPAARIGTEQEKQLSIPAPVESSTFMQAPGTADTPPPVDPCCSLQLQRINSYTGQFPRSLTSPPNSSEIVFASANVVVSMSGDGRSQRFFFGHTAHVTAIGFDGEGKLMATGQEGKEAIIRLWDFTTGHCLCMLTGHASNLVALDLSPDGRALVAVGLDSHGKQLMVLWDISDVAKTGEVRQLVKQVTEYNIKCVRFSVFEADHFMTCGQDSIRIYRLKNLQLRGLSIKIGPPSKRVTAQPGSVAALLGPNIFTDIAFEGGASAFHLTTRHVFVASAAGAVFQINYEQRALECIYQLHTGAINSLILHEGFCVTASDDKFLRVWPLDFTDYLLEAEHESAVTSLGINGDGLRVYIGTENGTIGGIDIPTHQYTTLMRSHNGAVNAVALDPIRPEMCSVASDGTIRIWALQSYQQLYEFDAPQEVVSCVAYHPNRYELACGFANGRMRVFDVPSTTLLQEHPQHRYPVVAVQYTLDGSQLLSLGEDGGLCVYDVTQIYLPVKMLAATGPVCTQACLALSADQRYLVTATHDQFKSLTSLLLFHAATLEPYMRIETDVKSFLKLGFTHDGRHLWALTAANQLLAFELQDGTIVRVMAGLHRQPATCFATHPQRPDCIVTAGQDLLIKVWSVPPLPDRATPAESAPLPHHSFLGHPGLVAGMVFSSDHLITVGEADCMYFWRLLQPVLPPQDSDLRRLAADVDKAAAQQLAADMDQLLRVPLHSPPHADVAGAGDQRPYSLAAAPPSPRQLPASSPSSLDQLLPSYKAVAGQPRAAPQLACSAVIGFTPHGASNVVWDPDTGLFAYGVDTLVVVEDLATRRQRYLRYHAQPVTCLAAAHSGKLLASAPLSAEASRHADVVVWNVAAGEKLRVLQYHPVSVQVLRFSADDRYLLSLGRDPERAVVVWDLAHGGELLAVGRTRGVNLDAAWLPLGAVPQFVSGGADGLLLWSLQASCLEQRSITLGMGGVRHVHAVAVDERSCVVAADNLGGIWEVVLSNGNAMVTRQVAAMPGSPVTHIYINLDHALIGTSSGLIASYRRSSGAPGCSELYSRKHQLYLDGALTALQVERGMTEAVAATVSATIWYINVLEASRVPLVSSHSAAVRSLTSSLADPNLVASTSKDGLLRIWQTCGYHEAEPLMEFQSAAGCCCCHFLSDGSGAVAGYEDGSLTLFDLQRVAVRWSTARHLAPLVAAHSHPSKPLILTASCDGALVVTELHTSRMTVYTDELHQDLVHQQAAAGTTPPEPARQLGGVALSRNPGASMCAAAFRDRLLVFTTPWDESVCRVVAMYLCQQKPGLVPGSVPAMAEFSRSSVAVIVYTGPLMLGQVVLFDYQAATVVRSISLPQLPACMALSPDGTLLVFGCTGASVFLVNYHGGMWCEMAGHLGPVTAVAFMADSKRLLSASTNTMFLWQPVQPSTAVSMGSSSYPRLQIE